MTARGLARFRSLETNESAGRHAYEQIMIGKQPPVGQNPDHAFHARAAAGAFAAERAPFSIPGRPCTDPSGALAAMPSFFAVFRPHSQVAAPYFINPNVAPSSPSAGRGFVHLSSHATLLCVLLAPFTRQTIHVFGRTSTMPTAMPDCGAARAKLCAPPVPPDQDMFFGRAVGLRLAVVVQAATGRQPVFVQAAQHFGRMNFPPLAGPSGTLAAAPSFFASFTRHSPAAYSCNLNAVLGVCATHPKIRRI